MEILINPSDLAGALKAVLPHTKKDDKLGTYKDLVQFEILPDPDFSQDPDQKLPTLRLTATDSYTMARSIVRPPRTGKDDDQTMVEGDRITVHLSSDSAKLLRTVVSKIKYGQIPVMITPNTVRVGYPERSSEGIELRTEKDQTYPRVDGLFGREAPREVIEEFFLNPEYLARFTTANLARDRYEKNKSLTVKFNRDANRPLTVTFSDHFEGLIMPMRKPQ